MSAKLKIVEPDSGLTDAAIEIAARRANTEREMKVALIAGDDQKALSLLRKHLGIDAKSHRTFKGLDRRTGRRRPRIHPVAANDQP